MNVLFETVSRMEEVSVLSEQVGTGIPSAGAVFENYCYCCQSVLVYELRQHFCQKAGNTAGPEPCKLFWPCQRAFPVPSLFAQNSRSLLGTATPFWGSAGRLFAICRGPPGPQTDDGPRPKGTQRAFCGPRAAPIRFQ